LRVIDLLPIKAELAALPKNNARNINNNKNVKFSCESTKLKQKQNLN